MAGEEHPLRIAIIGAGVSGLVCAKTLVASNLRAEAEVHLIDCENHVGGRVATDRREDGYLIDRGFQILIRSYPEIQKQLDLKALELQSFGQGAVLVYGKEQHVFANPLTCPWYILRTIRVIFIKWGLLGTILDICKLASRVIVPGWLGYFSNPYEALRKRWGLNVVEKLSKGGDVGHGDAGDSNDTTAAPVNNPKTTKEFLENRVGLTSGFYREFLDPFFEAIYVSPLAAQNPGMFEFVLRMLAVPGSPVLPKGGIQAIPDQLLQQIYEKLKADRTSSSMKFRLRLNETVGNVESDVHTKGVVEVIVNGKKERFDQVVIATEWLRALEIVKRKGKPSNSIATSSETWYFSLPEHALPVREPLIALNVMDKSTSSSNAGSGSQSALSAPLLDDSSSRSISSCSDIYRISNIGFPSVIQRSYAPKGYHLCAVTVMQKSVPSQGSWQKRWPQEEIFTTWIRNELSKLFPETDFSTWKFLDRKCIDFHQPSQAPDVLEDLLNDAKSESESMKSDSILYCGDWKGTPTLDGAMLTGRLAAEKAIRILQAS